jgi:hypothetical protein
MKPKGVNMETKIQVEQNDPYVWLEVETFENGYCAKCRLPFWQGLQVGVTPRDGSEEQMWVTMCQLCFDDMQAKS